MIVRRGAGSPDDVGRYHATLDVGVSSGWVVHIAAMLSRPARHDAHPITLAVV
jgi:hypothetical protein